MLTAIYIHAQERPQPVRTVVVQAPMNHPQAAAAPSPVPQARVMTTVIPALGDEINQLAGERFHFDIAPNTPVKDLLPPAPSVDASNLLVNDLTRVPQVELHRMPTRGPSAGEAVKQTAFTIAKINHLNKKKPEGFLRALCDARPDVAGLPFAMGGACRTTGERSPQFAIAVNTIRAALQSQGDGSMMNASKMNAMFKMMGARPSSGNVNIGQAAQPVRGGKSADLMVAASGPMVSASATTEILPEIFWRQFQTICAEQDQEQARADRTTRECITLARIGALMQILAPEPPRMRLGLIRYLAGVSHVEATRALARLAIFSAEDRVRQAAMDALQVRRERDYTDILLYGLHYPWPPSRSARARQSSSSRDAI